MVRTARSLPLVMTSSSLEGQMQMQASGAPRSSLILENVRSSGVHAKFCSSEDQHMTGEVSGPSVLRLEEQSSGERA